MRFLSVCSGIEAASCAWHPLGWRAAALSEIEAFPSAVLAHHYPEVPNLGDMTKFKEWNIDGAIDLLVGGTPCQSFSVAGLRKGLDDPRGNLMLTYLAIADRFRPRWLVWENVPGVLSSNGGREFGALLGGLGKLGYGFAYRVLDAQFFGVPQRRRRVFVVGCLGDWRRAAAVLFERHSLQGYPPPRREAGKEATARSLCSTDGGIDREDRHTLIQAVANPLTARMHKGINTTCDEGQTMIAFDCKRNAADSAREHVSPTLRAMNAAGGRANAGGQIAVGIPFDTTQITSKTNRSNPLPGDPCHPLARGAHSPAVAHVGVMPTMRAGGNKTGGDRPPGTDVDTSDSLLTTPEMQVRRLTPRECERLQGFPDDYTLIKVRYKPAADGPRYKALGNSMAVPVMRWIGERIALVDSIDGRAAA